jgi:hypothetical protein
MMICIMDSTKLHVEMKILPRLYPTCSAKPLQTQLYIDLISICTRSMIVKIIVFPKSKGISPLDTAHGEADYSKPSFSATF